MRAAFAALVAVVALAGGPAAADIRVNGHRLPDMRADEMPFVAARDIPNHSQLMRDIVVDLSAYAKGRNKNFVVLARGGLDLMVKGKTEAAWESAHDPVGAVADKYAPIGTVNRAYLRALDGVVMESMFCSTEAPAELLNPAEQKPQLEAVRTAAKYGLQTWTTEYCATPELTRAAQAEADSLKVMTFFGKPGLDTMPPGKPRHENADFISTLTQARNFLPMIRENGFSTRQDWVVALQRSNYDLLLIDAFHRGNDPLTFKELPTLKYKKLGSQRMVLAVLDLGMAGDDRYYWKKEWRPGQPEWLAAPFTDVAGRYVVQYWNAEWKEMVGQYMKALMDLGFDGVMLDSLDSYIYFEATTPVE